MILYFNILYFSEKKTYEKIQHFRHLAFFTVEISFLYRRFHITYVCIEINEFNPIIKLMEDLSHIS